VISDTDALRRAVDTAAAYANDGNIVTFGIVPDRPEIGYGYIRTGDELDDAFAIDRFVEKPDTDTATAYLESGEYLWNSGMFLFRADAYLSALDRHASDMAAALASVISASDLNEDTLTLDEATFAACPADSIDYAVMEHIDNGVVVPLDAGWSDIGSWDVLWDLSKKDVEGNVVDGDVVIEGVTNSIIRAADRLIAVVGLDDIAVVDTGDAILIAAKNRAQDVKNVVDQLRDAGRPEV
jgi:mannose-1-phosphate guanylyltransferase/mannose-6-phosphate isomerase